jgi:hypothetical protein
MVEYVDFMYMDEYEVDGPYEIQLIVDGYDVGVCVTPTNDQSVDLTKLSNREVYDDYLVSCVSDSQWSTFIDWRTPENEVMALAHDFADVINEVHYDDCYDKFPLEEVKENFFKLVRDAIVKNNELFAAGEDCPFKEEVSLYGLEKVSVEIVDFKYYCLVTWHNLLKWRNKTYA